MIPKTPQPTPHPKPSTDCHNCNSQAVRIEKLVKQQSPQSEGEENFGLQKKKGPLFRHYTIYICPRCDLNRPDLALEGPSPKD